MSEVFILGAGFSRAINEAMPTLRELSEHVLPALRSRDRRLADRLERIGPNVELWMSYLSHSQPWLRVEQNQYNLSIAGEIRRLICSHIDALVRETDAVPDWLRALVSRWHEERVSVLTLNYDTLIERVACGVTVPEPDGRERGLYAGDLYPRYFVDAATRGASIWGAEPVLTFKLLKLHGSTNWYYSGQSDYFGESIMYARTAPLVAEGVPVIREQDLAVVADKGALVIPPVTEKTTYFKNETIGRVWWEAAQALRAAARVFVIGYSLPESDLGMRAFLGTVVRIEGVEVFVIDTNENVLGRYRDLLRWSNINREFIGGREPVAMFATSYCAGEV